MCNGPDVPLYTLISSADAVWDGKERAAERKKEMERECYATDSCAIT